MRMNANTVFFFLLYKASDGNRTRDLLTTNEVRYHLCHASKSYSVNKLCEPKSVTEGNSIIMESVLSSIQTDSDE